jgi:hypothetical protein
MAALTQLALPKQMAPATHTAEVQLAATYCTCYTTHRNLAGLNSQALQSQLAAITESLLNKHAQLNREATAKDLAQ